MECEHGFTLSDYEYYLGINIGMFSEGVPLIEHRPLSLKSPPSLYDKTRKCLCEILNSLRITYIIGHNYYTGISQQIDK